MHQLQLVLFSLCLSMCVSVCVTMTKCGPGDIFCSIEKWIELM